MRGDVCERKTAFKCDGSPSTCMRLDRSADRGSDVSK